MATFILSHKHDQGECRAAFAAWNGFESPLRRRPTIGSCANGGHRIFWTVEATSTDEALSQLPPFVAARTEISEVREVAIP